MCYSDLEGIGIVDIDQAKAPFYSSKADEERSGMGFSVMESFMDELIIDSKPNEGTKVILIKRIKSND